MWQIIVNGPRHFETTGSLPQVVEVLGKHLAHTTPLSLRK